MRLEYKGIIWSPFTCKNIYIRKLEKIQTAATKLVPSLMKLSYEERLDKLKIPTLEERKERGDIIMVLKCLK